MVTGERALRTIYRGYAVKRFHTNDTVRTQTVGQHSAGVAALCWVLSEGSVRKEVLLYCLMHDIGEQYTGDIPSPFKRSEIGLRSFINSAESSWLASNLIDLEALHLTEEEKAMVKLADALDGIVFCYVERQCNNDIDTVARTFIGYVQELLQCSRNEISYFAHSLTANGKRPQLWYRVANVVLNWYDKSKT